MFFLIWNLKGGVWRGMLVAGSRFKSPFRDFTLTPPLLDSLITRPLDYSFLKIFFLSLFR